MIEELHTASELLRSALDRYLNACANFANHYDPRTTLNQLSRSLSDSVANELQLVNLNHSARSLPDSITTELQLVDSYGGQLKQAKAIIRRIRNDTPAVVPISALPSDILTDIFQLVQHGHSCTNEGFELPDSSWDYYPGLISQVCSRWRQITLSLQYLWSHIDLSQSPTHCKRLLPRAKLHAARAGHRLLDIHVLHGLPSNREGPQTELIDFCVSIAPQMRCLEFAMHHDFESPTQSVLWSCFANCVPGTLTQLTLSNNSRNDTHIFFEAAGNPANPSSLLLDLPHLEDTLLRVTTLRLDQVFPYWTSKAYHGLVELHLLASTWETDIPESQLVQILSSSPELRVFHFGGLRVRDRLPRGALPVPINLKSLEVLNLKATDCDRHGDLLRWLSPASSPLQLTLYFTPDAGSLLGDAFISFYARSNITELNLLKGDTSTLSLRSLLALLPKLRILRLDDFKLEEESNGLPGHDGPLPHCPPELDAMHIRNCIIYLNELQWVAKTHSIHTITVYRGWFYLQFEGVLTPVRTEDTPESHLSGIAPVVKVLTRAEADFEWSPQLAGFM